MAQWVKLLPVMPDATWVLILVPAASLLIQLPAKCLGKQWKMTEVLGPLLPTWETG